MGCILSLFCLSLPLSGPCGGPLLFRLHCAVARHNAGKNLLAGSPLFFAVRPSIAQCFFFAIGANSLGAGEKTASPPTRRPVKEQCGHTQGKKKTSVHEKEKKERRKICLSVADKPVRCSQEKKCAACVAAARHVGPLFFFCMHFFVLLLLASSSIHFFTNFFVTGPFPAARLLRRLCRRRALGGPRTGAGRASPLSCAGGNANHPPSPSQ